MSSELETIKDTITRDKAYLAETYGVKEIGIFGSVARGEATATSDIDMIVGFSKPIGLEFMSLAVYLEKILGRKVDLMTRKSIRPAFQKYILPTIIPII
ncbi:MAG: nucleotidyltransferase family protein [bacterium]